MGRAAWLLVVPAPLIVINAWLYLYNPSAASKGIVTAAAVVVSAAFIVWGVIGQGPGRGQSIRARRLEASRR